MSTLVIVESPTKAKTISKFLGRAFVVRSSFGHVRDLPKSKMGVDTENNFEPKYVVSKDKAATVKELKDLYKKAGKVLFATDADREGEAISWHLASVLGVDDEKVKRVVFHEITKDAILHAMESPRPLDLKLVNAQQARRILDRLVGYELSPFLWHKVAKGLSAGRVQSVAVRLVVEREREIQAFKAEEYWSIDGLFSTEKNKEQFEAKLHSIAGKKVDKMEITNKDSADKILTELKNSTYIVSSIESKDAKRLPSPAFTTSTLQQEGNNRHGFSAKQTMRLAQQLYEGVAIGAEGQVGLITYMRTDSVNLSEKFLTESKDVINKEFGDKYSLAKPRTYTNKSKNAQEAHEAIRPSDVFRTPDSLKNSLDAHQYKLYDLIWRRAVATQMAPAEMRNVSANIESDNSYVFRATGQTIVFDGFLKLYPERTKENILPVMKKDETVICDSLTPEQHFTEPPARYSDATLVKILEEHGIGRPSTYAPTIATIEDRGYVERDEKKKLMPKEIAYTVNDLLVEHFPNIVNYQFTADMEENLDAVARGEKKWQPIIKEFYMPFKKTLELKEKELGKYEEKTDEICEKCAKPMSIKIGRFGKFLACTGYPECKNSKPLPGSKEAEAVQPIDEKCEKCGKPMVKKMGRFGPFIACSGYPECKNIKGIEKKTGVKCPKCETGEIVAKKSKRGRMFYACNKYPDCKYALWEKPNGEKCPQCKELLTQNAKGLIKCGNKECDYKREAPETPTTEPVTPA
ncbi:MAG: type I DNA topoisomerase [bacterium]|nr:type I DNA topoisomerase [bacterium]